MLLVWRTPPRSDLFDAPARNLLIVVSLLPKASRKAYGKFLAIKRLIRELGNGFFYFNCVQVFAFPDATEQLLPKSRISETRNARF